jgi:hypothetical protein
MVWCGVVWWQVVAAAHAKDNSEDKDGDGIADVDQIDATTLFWRKVRRVCGRGRRCGCPKLARMYVC